MLYFQQIMYVQLVSRVKYHVQNMQPVQFYLAAHKTYQSDEVANPQTKVNDTLYQLRTKYI